MKFCKVCNDNKPIDEFYNNKNYKDGKTYMCITCSKKYRKKYKKTDRSWTSNKGLTKDEIREKNLKRMRDWVNEHRVVNRNEKITKQIFNKPKRVKLTDEEKRKKARDFHREYTKRKRKEDDLYRFVANMRCRVQNFLKIKNIRKNKNTTADFIGGDYEFVKKYIESKFSEGMSWKNNTRDGWHIDHIIPLSSAKNEEEALRLLHYTNLQPLWATDNLRKSCKLNYELQ